MVELVSYSHTVNNIYYTTSKLTHLHKMQSLDLNALSTDLKICVTENNHFYKMPKITRWRWASECMRGSECELSLNTRERENASQSFESNKIFTYIKIKWKHRAIVYEMSVSTKDEEKL